MAAGRCEVVTVSVPGQQSPTDAEAGFASM
jgi:hypothetical protein